MKELQEFRTEIDSLDDLLVQILQKRIGVVRDLMVYKQQEGLPIEDLRREQEIIERYRQSMNPNFVYSFFSTIFEESKRAGRGE